MSALEGQRLWHPHESSCITKAIHASSQGFEIAIVIGGGNIFRGTQLKIWASAHAGRPDGHAGHPDQWIALQEALELLACPARVITALDCPKVAETYTWRRRSTILNGGKFVIFVGGTGNPYFTTDTAAALRASEIHADIIQSHKGRWRI